jgi:ribosomal protein L11 methyltransferase
VDDPLRELLAEGLLALGGLSVVEKGEALTTYLPPPPDPEARIAEAERFLADWLLDDDPPRLSWRWQANEDWEREWKRGLAPRRVSERIVVKPSWTEWRPEAGQVVIDIDPEMAFGTGEHATTRGCLRLLDGAVREGERVLDVGSGSGILAIAAARLGAREVVAVEYDPDANLNARDNIQRNAAGERIRIVESLADPQLLEELGPFDLILANILSGVIRPLLPAFRSALRETPDGRLIVSGILRAEREEVLRDALAAGFRLEREDAEEEWWSALLATSPSHPPTPDA